MKFGAMVATKIDDWKLLVECESLGYDHGWVPDSQMIWSDCYATLALVAEHTSRMKLGTGVAIAPTRLAPVTAHSIASIARLAPGRVFLGIGTGHTAMRVMGMKPMVPREFREYLRVVRGLLAGEEVEYSHGAETRPIRFLNLDRKFIELDPPIPIWVAANGPGALRAAGAYGDGRISALHEPPEMTRRSLAAIQQGARETKRTLPSDFHTAALTTAVVLRPGESLASERVIDACGSQVAAAWHYAWEGWRMNPDAGPPVPPSLVGLFEEYCAYVDKMETPPDKRYLQVHEGHCAFLVPVERRFVTPDAIRTWILAGTPDEIIASLHAAESAGLREITLLPPIDFAREQFRDFAKHVIERY
jgi:alkanesulfonate monooxygenase SsuD/methylene tetrahydromethanopterin reductase-like flavin-dependent oxidoreductase (luciferase family)